MVYHVIIVLRFVKCFEMNRKQVVVRLLLGLQGRRACHHTGHSRGLLEWVTANTITDGLDLYFAITKSYWVTDWDLMRGES